MSWIRLVTALVALVAIASASKASADAPGLLPIQGYLSDADGKAVDGALSIRFRLYNTDSPTGAPDEILFEEQVAVVNVSKGYFTVYLGDSETLELSLFGKAPRVFVGMLLSGDTEELTPLLQLATAPYAAYGQFCNEASKLGGKSANDFLAADYLPQWSTIQSKPSTFAPTAHQHTWNDLTNVPNGLADGDNDALGGLSCADGQIAKVSGGKWTCGSNTYAAEDVTSGTLSNARFSAYSDLAAEGYLDNSAATDLLTRAQGDARFAAASHTHSGADISSGTVPAARVDAYTRAGADARFTQVKACYWKTSSCPTNPPTGAPPNCQLLCDTGDLVMSGGCAAAAGAVMRETMPNYSVAATNGRWTAPQMIGWYCRTSSGQLNEIRVMCCPSI